MKIMNDEIIDTLEYFKLNFAKDKKAIEHFNKAIEIIEGDNSKKESTAEAIKRKLKYSDEIRNTVVPIKPCPHLLPCGFCDKFGLACSQYQ